MRVEAYELIGTSACDEWPELTGMLRTPVDPAVALGWPTIKQMDYGGASRPSSWPWERASRVEPGPALK